MSLSAGCIAVLYQCEAGRPSHVLTRAHAPCNKETRASLIQRDRATAVCSAYARRVHCAVVHTLFKTCHHLAAVCAVLNKVVTACNSEVGQYKPIFQIKGNIFRPVYFGYFVAD